MKKNRNLILFMPFIGGGGVEKNLFLIANYLSRKFDKIFVCTLSRDKKKKFTKKIKFLCPKNNFENLNIRIKYLISLFLLFKFLIKNKNSVVFAFQANIYCVLLCKLLNIKIIIRSNSSPSGWYHNKIKKIIYKKIISLADKVIVNSIEFKKQMENNFNIKVNCIFNPLNIKQIIKDSKKRPTDNFFKKKNCLKLINLGRFTKQKDQITILKASKILKNFIDFRLLIYGRGIEKEKLQRFINNNQLKKHVKLKNFTENPYKIIKQSDIFILSSKYEGLPNVLLEAASLKKLIISTKCPTGPGEILSYGKGGIFFKMSDPKDLVKKIKFATNNRKEMKKKINFCFRKLKRYNYKENMNKYFHLVKNQLEINS